MQKKIPLLISDGEGALVIWCFLNYPSSFLRFKEEPANDYEFFPPKRYG